MPGENIHSWSTTAANNATADSSINLAEGHARNLVNDNKRSMMAALAKHRDLTNGSKTTGGSANAQTLTTGMSFTSVPTGMRVLVKNGFTNTGSMTFNMDSIGAVTVKDIYANDLIGGEVRASGYSEYLYDGTNWILLQEKTGLVLLANASASASSSIDFTTGIDDTFDEYVISLSNVVPATNGVALQLQVSVDGGSSWEADAGDYHRTLSSISSAGADTVSGSTTETSVTLIGVLGNTAAWKTGGEIRFFHPHLTSAHIPFNWTLSNYDGSVYRTATGGAIFTGDATAVDGVRLKCSSGNIATMEAALYGVRK